MKNVHGYKGYCFIFQQKPTSDEQSPVDQVHFNPVRGPWKTDEPLVIYPTIADLVSSKPDFDKKTDIIGEVQIQLLGERIQVISYGPTHAE